MLGLTSTKVVMATTFKNINDDQVGATCFNERNLIRSLYSSTSTEFAGFQSNFSVSIQLQLIRWNVGRMILQASYSRYLFCYKLIKDFKKRMQRNKLQ